MAESLPIPFREADAPPGTPPLLLFFEEVAIKDEKASMDGPPVYDRAVHCRVIVAGSRGDGPIYEIQRTKDDGTIKRDEGPYQRFKEPFLAWMKGQSPSERGTPLEQWPGMDVALVAQLKASNVYTVQQVADLSDSQIESCFRRGGREWRAKAIAYLGEAKTEAQNAKLARELAKRDGQIAELQEQVKQLLQKQNNMGFDKPTRKNRSVAVEEVLETPAEDDLRL